MKEHSEEIFGMFKISNRKEYPYYLDIFSFLLKFFLCRIVDSSTNFKR